MTSNSRKDSLYVAYLGAFETWHNTHHIIHKGKKCVFAVSRYMFRGLYDMFKDKEDIAFISIEHTSDAAALAGFEDNEHYAPESDRVLNMRFDDVERDEEEDGHLIKAMSEEQAVDMVAFIERNLGKNFIVHCRAGRSRSQGVLYALMNGYPDVFEHDGLNDLNPCSTPNYHVSSLLLRVIRGWV